MSRRFRTERYICLVLFLMLIYGSYQICLAQQTDSKPQQDNASNNQTTVQPETPLLEPGKSIERGMKGGESHSYAIKLEADQYLQAVVEQKGIDVVVAVYAPDGKKVYEIDSPNGANGPEPVYLVAEVSGNFRIIVRSDNQKAAAGKYEINIVEQRAANQQDRDLVEAQQLSIKAEKLKAEGKYNDSIQMAEKALNIREKYLGSNDLMVAKTLYTLGELYIYKGDFAKAEQLYQRALAIREKALGPDHSQVAEVLNDLAVIYYFKGDYEKAAPLYLRAISIKERTIGPDHPEFASSINNLAALYYSKGDYDKAEPLYQRALAIREKALGPDHPDVAETLNNLSELYRIKGDYTKAEPLYQRALAIREKALGPDHPVVANSLNNLALFYNNKGDYEKAEPLYQRALSIREKALGPNHPDVAVSLYNLAFFYFSKNDSVKAEPLFQRALSIREKALGPNHPDIASVLNSLAIIYCGENDYGKAEPLLQRALAIKEKALGPNHPDVATLLYNLAFLFTYKNDYEKAEPLFQKALAIREKALGQAHPDVARTFNSLAINYLENNDIKQAIEYKEKADDSREQELMRNLSIGSEKQKLAYLNLTLGEYSQTLSLHLQFAPNDIAAARDAMVAVLRRKGRALDVMSDSIAILRRRANAQDQVLLDDLASTRAQYSLLTLRGPGREGIEKHRADLKQLADKIESLENQISSRSLEFKTTTQPITLESVQKLIPDSAVLIEFALYRPYDLKEKRVLSLHYAVYILTNKGEPSFADLGEANSINKAISELRKTLPDKQSSINREVKPAARALDELVMKPVRKLIGDKRRLLIAPDGALNLIPFDALVDEQGKYLIESYEISYLTSGRDLLRLQNGIVNKQPPTIVANPDFGGEGNSSDQRLFKYKNSAKKNSIDADQQVGSKDPGEFDFSNLYFNPLPGTAEEAKSIATLLPEAHLLTQADASKANLVKIDSPEILHIATHGFFISAQDIAGNVSARGLAFAQIDDKESQASAVAHIDPLLRSGLAFAQSNQHAEQGILTALEATGLDLWGTKLVVLSACDTGVGEIKNGDGVYGLRRALVLAGSETQMMSLWPVSDLGTRELMTSFYRNLKAGMGRSGSLRDVQLKMIANPKRAHPFFWASFIQSGEWANLAGKR